MNGLTSGPPLAMTIARHARGTCPRRKVKTLADNADRIKPAGSGAGAIGDRSLPRALLACYEDGETALSSMSHLYIWALSHGCSTEELSDTAYVKFRHDEASEQVDSAAGNGYDFWLDREWTNGAIGSSLRL